MREKDADEVNQVYAKMKFISIVILVIAIYSSSVYSIHNGYIVEPNSIPYHVLIIVKNSDHSSKCGGSLVKVDRVLTAAHCLKGKDTARVTVGAHRLHDVDEDSRQTQSIDSDSMFPHPLWAAGKGHDIGMIKLPEAFELNEYVALVKLPFSLEGYTFVGETGKVSGWGRIDDEEDNNGALRAVENPIISNEECRKHGIRIDSGNICMSVKHGRKICSGDSGSPLVIRHKGDIIQVGVVSKTSDIGCDDFAPSIFTRVTHFLEVFIKDHL